jgi:hypothetical protein
VVGSDKVETVLRRCNGQFCVFVRVRVHSGETRCWIYIKLVVRLVYSVLCVNYGLYGLYGLCTLSCALTMACEGWKLWNMLYCRSILCNRHTASFNL